MSTHRQTISPDAPTPNVSFRNVELHLNNDPDFTRTHGRKVKKAGGSYGDVRGYSTTRIVHVPASERDLIHDIVRKYGTNMGKGTCMIARGLVSEAQIVGDAKSWVVVNHVKTDHPGEIMDEFDRQLQASWANAHGRCLLYTEKKVAPPESTFETTLHSQLTNAQMVALETLGQNLGGLTKVVVERARIMVSGPNADAVNTFNRLVTAFVG